MDNTVYTSKMCVSGFVHFFKYSSAEVFGLSVSNQSLLIQGKELKTIIWTEAINKSLHFYFQTKEILQEEEDLSEIVQLVGKVR